MGEITFSQRSATKVDHLLAQCAGRCDTIIIVADSNTSRLVVPKLIEGNPRLAESPIFTFPAGEESKTIATTADLWHFLTQHKATRHSIIVNVGGGVVSDLGGFAASTYMRGLRFINVPTTLLSAVDASVGGKNGIDFAGNKNMVGTFSHPEGVAVTTEHLATLPVKEIKSGYAEMVKHAMLSSTTMFDATLDFDLSTPFTDSSDWIELIEANVEVKRRIVEADFKESGLRKALNLGHTIGHAVESVALHRKAAMPHGYAVAWGLLGAMVLSHIAIGAPATKIYPLAQFVKELYGPFPFDCSSNDSLIEAMRHDKKNSCDNDTFNFTLLEEIGHPVTNCELSEQQIIASLDIVRDLTGA